LIAVAIAVGLLIDLSLGAVGGGGSILTVPALVYLLDQTPHAATTGSLLIVGVTALAGMVAHWRSGRVRVGQGMVFGVLGVAGAYGGSRLSADINPDLLLAGFAILLIGAAVAMLRRARRDLGRPSTVTASCKWRSPIPRLNVCRFLRVFAAATVVGLLTGLFGVGGGFVIVPALVLALGFSMPVAVGTSLLVIAINSAVALAVRMGEHTHLDWPLLALFTVTAIGGSLIGNRVASRVDAAKLTTAFSFLLVAVALYTAARSVPHLL
jgi:uncharacterized membrane protein YfcA